MQISEQHLARMRVPKTHWESSLDKIPNACGHKSVMTRYLQNIYQHIEVCTGLLLFGEYSAGKSALASLCLKYAAHAGVIGYWISAADLPRYQIEGEMFDEELTCYERARTVPLLVIDEYFMRREMKWTEDAVDALVRSRIDEVRCTIITTNHAPSQIEESRPALAAALREATYPVKVAGHDFRTQIMKGKKI